MSQLKPTTAAFVVAIFLMMAVSLTFGQSCKPEMNKIATMEYKTKYSDILVYGFPRQRTKDTSMGGQDVYIVDFEVRCIFKGGPLPEMIRIHNVGKLDPMCKPTEMAVNTPLIIYLSREGNRLVPSYKEDSGAPQYLEEVPVICTITVRYPTGFSADNNKEECPEEWIHDDCVRLPTTEIPMATVKPDNKDNEGPENEAPYQPVKDGSQSSKGGEETKNTGAKESKKSENLEVTTRGGRAGHTTASLITSLGAVAVCLFVYFVRV